MQPSDLPQVMYKAAMAELDTWSSALRATPSAIGYAVAAALTAMPDDLLRKLVAERGCVMVPREPTEAMVNAGLKAADDAAFCFIGSVIKYESTRPHLARLAYKAMLAAADPREQALDRMAENAQELGLYDTARAALQGAKDSAAQEDDK